MKIALDALQSSTSKQWGRLEKVEFLKVENC
jgi:hypothetical protein